MSLFGFGDIKFNKTNSPTSGPLRALEGTAFDVRSLRYPADIGSYDKGHYMVFYIREQKKSSYAKNDNVSDDVINASKVSGATQFQNVPLVGNAATNFGSDLLGKLNSGLGAVNSATGGALSGITSAVSKAAGGVVGSVNSLFGQAASIVTGDAAQTQSVLSTNIASIKNSSFIKTTQLTKDAIALYMPDTLQFSYKQTYDQLTPGTELAGQAAAAGRTIMDAYSKEGGSGALSTAYKAGESVLKKKVGETAGNLLGSPQSGQIAGYLLSNRVTNPLLELIYKSPNFRTFQFDFMFYPRDEKEALEVQQIVERFRFHQAPEFAKETSGFLIPPSEFDIRFYYGGEQNPNIPKIGTCVLTDIDLDYAPNGWSAYEIPGESQPQLGRTGMPVAMKMTLQFQEVVYLTKADFRDASSVDGGGTFNGVT
jgi:hypothetical protein